MGTTTLLSLVQKLSEQIDDWIEIDTTSNIAASTKVITSTTLNEYDLAEDDHFNNQWAYITEGVNIGEERRISDYTFASGLVTVYGANLAAETAAVTVRVGAYRNLVKKNSIINAVTELYPHLFKRIDDMTLVTGNILPNSHFEDWLVTTTPDFYTAGAGTTAANTTASYFRGGTKAVKATAGATSDKLLISSDDYPRLLDLMDKTVTLKVWAHPEVANDATIQIYTEAGTATAQTTLVSTTTCTAGSYSLLELEDQELSDSLTKVEVRFIIATDTKYVYWDDARLTGMDIREYLLPTDLQKGHVSKVYIQSQGYSDDICDDLHPREWEEVFGFTTIVDSDNGYKYLRLPYSPLPNRRIRIIGYTPLETLSADTDTIATDDSNHIKLILAYAEYLMWSIEEGTPSVEDIRRYTTKAARAYNKYRSLLPTCHMLRPSESMIFGEF